MTVRIKRVVLLAKLSSMRDFWWWTTDAAGDRVNTIMGIQTSRIEGTATHYGGRSFGVILGPLHMGASWLDRVKP